MDVIEEVKGLEHARTWRWSNPSGICGANADWRDDLKDLS
jgi:hypothetical protein